jgi:hypothetical protein
MGMEYSLGCFSCSASRGFFAPGLENGSSRFGGRTWFRVCGS